MKSQMYSAPGERPWKELGNGTRRRIRSFDAAMMAVEVAFDEGGIGLAHTHPHRQLTYCIEGEFEFDVAGEKVRLCAGDTIVFPDGAVHGCVARKAGVLLDIFTPAREEFAEADGLA